MSLQNALRAYNGGDLRGAYHLCQQFLATQPNHAVALNLMGAISGSGGRHDLAVQWMRRAAEAVPEDLSYRINYLTALLRSGRTDEAKTALSSAMEDFPENGELTTMKAILVGREGDQDVAAELLERAIALDPSSASAHFNLSVIRRNQGDLEASIQFLRRALELDPNNSQAVNNLAGALLDTGEFLEALKLLQKFLELQPRSAQAYFNLSVALDAAGDTEQSLVALRNALTLEPKLHRGQFKLANQLIASGSFDEANKLLEEWQSKEPDEPRLNALFSRFLERQGRLEEAREVLDRVKPEDRSIPAVQMSEATLLEVEGKPVEAAEILECVLEKRGADAAESLGIRFQLGGLYDSAKDYDRAFENYQVGNQLRRKGLAIPFNGEQLATNFGKIADAYVEGWKQHVKGSGIDSPVPIFILGMPRSGTSLTEQMLGCHSKIYPAGELQEFSTSIKATWEDSDESKRKSRGGFTIVENDLTGRQSPVIPDDFESSTLQRIGTEYVETVVAMSNGEAHVTDKMPYNYLFAPLIQMAIPNAKIIHTRRNPVDTCLSCYFQNFSGGSEFSFDLHDAGVYYRNYVAVMDRWRDEVGLEMLELDYEETVTDTEAVVRRVLDYCGLEFEEGCLSAHKSKRAVVTASYQQVREPVYTKSVARWKHYEQHLGPLLEALGPLAE